ncbi:MAG: hypothetical protein HY885_17050 [Deltaproteobacteria bacterium]|nr:hypothetical protein [Deltaproteobacteria bacterium]
MNIIIGNTPNVKKDPDKNPFQGRSGRTKHSERRKSRRDRRKSVGEGVIVSLTFPNDRRNKPERRRD